MESSTMGKTVVKARITNLNDLLNAKKGLLKPEQIRSVEVEEALVDTGAKYLGLPKGIIQQLGLEPATTRIANTAAGKVPCNMYHAVRLAIQGRECSVDVNEVPDTCPVLVGFLPLEILDFVVDPVKQQVVGQHGEQEIIELY
jgi:predicted aspartyl protease